MESGKLFGQLQHIYGPEHEKFKGSETAKDLGLILYSLHLAFRRCWLSWEWKLIVIHNINFVQFIAVGLKLSYILMGEVCRWKLVYFILSHILLGISSHFRSVPMPLTFTYPSEQYKSPLSSKVPGEMCKVQLVKKPLRTDLWIQIFFNIKPSGRESLKEGIIFFYFFPPK